MRLSARPVLSGISKAYNPQCQRYTLISWRCYSDSKSRTYDDAISLLNTLQTPYAELKRQWDAGIIRGAEDLQHTKDCFARLGYVSSDLDQLNIVHVAGTKGKGTVCAYIESILNQYRKSRADHNVIQKTYSSPRKIGLYTSPHLISVRERIRIDSSPISEALFTKYFFEVWDKICVPDQQGKPPPSPLPVYFRFLTLMSFHVFISESVDVAIYEVGMGGEYDATNIIEKPAVTGISSLGIDHTFHLGNKIESIAWHKAGIFKANVPAFTVEQPSKAMPVLVQRAEAAKTDGFSVMKQDLLLKGIKILPDASFQKQNASLAIALTKEVLQRINPGKAITWPKTHLPSEFVNGLETLVSRGRCETIVTEGVMWYLDGAHTEDSIRIATTWFHSCVKDNHQRRILIFNQQGHRESMELLEELFAASERLKLLFDYVIFCPSTPPASSTRKDHVNHQTDHEAVAALTMQRKFADRWEELSRISPLFDPQGANPELRDRNPLIAVVGSLEEEFKYIEHTRNALRGDGIQDVKLHVFITGSIHLVGRALSLLEDGSSCKIDVRCI